MSYALPNTHKRIHYCTLILAYRDFGSFPIEQSVILSPVSRTIRWQPYEHLRNAEIQVEHDLRWQNSNAILKPQHFSRHGNWSVGLASRSCTFLQNFVKKLKHQLYCHEDFDSQAEAGGNVNYTSVNEHTAGHSTLRGNDLSQYKYSTRVWDRIVFCK